RHRQGEIRVSLREGGDVAGECRLATLHLQVAMAGDAARVGDPGEARLAPVLEMAVRAGWSERLTRLMVEARMAAGAAAAHRGGTLPRGVAAGALHLLELMGRAHRAGLERLPEPEPGEGGEAAGRRQGEEDGEQALGEERPAQRV